MGCFTFFYSKKKKYEQITYTRRINPQEHSPTTLPEPHIQTPSLQSAPSSFRTRVKPVQPTNNRTRTLSAPSSLTAAEQYALSSIEIEEMKEYRSPSPQPLPLPSPHAHIHSASSLKTMGSFKSATSSGTISASGPLPLPPSGILRNFSYEELAAACHNFSPEHCMSGLSLVMYRACFGDEFSGSKKIDATVTRLHPSVQGLREFVNEVNTLASLQHPNLCKLIGYHARDGSEQRMLVYERLFHGSLDRLLYGRFDGPPINWNVRVKVALCAAQGLTFLHEEGPFQAMFNELSTANIQIDKDFSAKLSGYGGINHVPEIERSNSAVAMANLSVENGLLTPKSNVWSFGIVLLELLTGRKNRDSRHPKEERNLVTWSRPFLADDCRLSLIMDPQLKGRFPTKAARTVADIAQRCLQRDPSERPTMRTVFEHLKTIQDMKYSCLFPLQEPGTVFGKHMFKSPSLSGIINPSPSGPPSMSLPPRTCFPTLPLVVVDWQESRKSPSSMVRQASFKGV